MIRLVLIILFFLVSLLSLFKAPAYYLWLLAVMVTEYPLIFAGIATMLTLSGFWMRNYQLAGTVLGLVTVLVFLSPIARAFIAAQDMQQHILPALGDPSSKVVSSHTRPFSFWKLFSGTKKAPYRSLTYINYPGISLAMDFYPSHVIGKRPCIIVVHGGSWSSGDSGQVPELNSYLAGKGYNVAAINYRMAPEYQSPAPVEDIRAAMVYLRDHADQLHIDTAKFVLLGRSAGAQIALLAAYTLHEPGLKGVIDFYGPADMVWGYSVPSNPLIMDSRKVMEDYIGGTYNAIPQKYKASSPVEFVNPGSVPTLIIHGENDVLVAYEHSRRLDKKLQQKGIKHYWLRLPWATHGFDYHLNGPGGQLSTYAVETFLNTIIK